MNYLNIPRTDLRASKLCLGIADYGAGISEADSFALLDAFREGGGNFFDTAAIYADWTPAGKGSSERVLGRYLASKSDVEGVLVATKGAHPELKSITVPRMSFAEVESDVDDSLRNLGREAIDLYYLHRDDPNTPVETILEMLEAFVQAGKIRYYAFSNWKQPRAQEALEVAQSRGFKGFVASQQLWSAAKPDMSSIDSTLTAMDDEFVKWHEANNVAAIPYTSQANGYFQKLLAQPPVELSGGVKNTYDSEVVREFNRARLEKIRALAKAENLSVTAVVLGFLWSHKFPVVPVIGPRNQEQLRDCLAAERQFSENIDFSI